MLRIHFDPGDLGRVSIAPTLDPLSEVALAARALRHPGAPRQVRHWRHDVRPRLAAQMRPLFELVPGAPGFPDFLTPMPDPSLDRSLAMLLDVETARIAEELDGFSLTSPWCRRLAGGDAAARRELAVAIRAFDAVALSPFERQRRHGFAATQATWAETVLAGGVEQLLGSLHPDCTWADPVLSFDSGGNYVNDVYLRGRGLLLYPSAFTPDPLVLDQPDRAPLLTVPVAVPASWGQVSGTVTGGELAALVGGTRAAVLAALMQSASTTELARRTGISLASASEHARVLRGSGLVATHREAGAAKHRLTPLGRQLLNASEAS